MKILFWNMRKRDLSHALSSIVTEKDIDLIVVVESSDSGYSAIEKLNKEKMIFELIDNNDDMYVMSRTNAVLWSTLCNTSRLLILRYNEPIFGSIGFAFVHLQSLLYCSRDSLDADCCAISADIDAHMINNGISKYCVAGDFNSDPFNNGMVSKRGFNSSIDPLNRKSMYNPTWTLYGNKKAPFGSYYYTSGQTVELKWHFFDQFLLSGQLTDTFREIQLVDNFSGTPLISKTGRPLRNTYSDHLPLILTLEI